MVVYQKASVGVYLFCCICSKKEKKNQKQKEGIKFLKKKKKEKKKELFSCIIFNKRLEENRKVVSGIA